MNRYTALTVTKRIVGIAVRLRHARHARTRGSVVAWKYTSFGAVSHILRETGDMGRIAHLHYGGDWGRIS
jgi:hypothetical protein